MAAQPPCTWASLTSGLHPQEPAPPPGSQAAHGVSPSLEATQVPAVPAAREGGDTRPRSWGTAETGDSRGRVSCCHLWGYCLQSLRTWSWELVKGGEEAGTSLAVFRAGRAVCPGLRALPAPHRWAPALPSARLRSRRSPGHRARAGRRTQTSVEVMERSHIAVHPANQNKFTCIIAFYYVYTQLRRSPWVHQRHSNVVKGLADPGLFREDSLTACSLPLSAASIAGRQGPARCH